MVRATDASARLATPQPAAGEHSLIVSRLLDAPQALAFKVCSTAEHLHRWFGPKDFSVTTAATDFRPGGEWRVGIRSPQGEVSYAQGVYREIDAPHRLVFTFYWSDDNRTGRETLVTVSFEAVGEKTRLIFHQTPFETVDNRDSHVGGWNECFDRLQDYVESL